MKCDLELWANSGIKAYDILFICYWYCSRMHSWTLPSISFLLYYHPAINWLRSASGYRTSETTTRPHQLEGWLRLNCMPSYMVNLETNFLVNCYILHMASNRLLLLTTATRAVSSQPMDANLVVYLLYRELRSAALFWTEFTSCGMKAPCCLFVDSFFDNISQKKRCMWTIL